MQLKRTSAIVAILLAVLTVIAGYIFFVQVPITSYPAPPRTEVSATIPNDQSVIVAPIGISLDDIRMQLENDVPRRLWSINRKLENCVPSREVPVLNTGIIELPKIGCTVVGNVTRGRISLTGSGDVLVVSFPANASIRAEDVGGVIDRETATGSATVELRARLALDRNWRTQADIELSYQWAEEPGIDFLGQRIRFTDQADSQIRPIAAKIEQSLEQQIKELDVRSEVATLWSQAFMVESLNPDNPPVWVRVEPKQVGVGPFTVKQGQMLSEVMLVADTRIEVGTRPETPQIMPLGENVPVDNPAGLHAIIPIFADYEELEPVVLDSLKELAKDGLQYQGIGSIDASFEAVEMYATDGGRIAIGLSATVNLLGSGIEGFGSRTSGKIWLTGKPVTLVGSRVLKIENLEIFGDMDSTAGDLLIRIASSQEITDEIEQALVEDFKQDYDELVAKVRAGTSSIRLRGVNLRFDITSIEHGQVIPIDNGLYMSVSAAGSASAMID